MDKKEIQKINMIYEHLADDMSKKIFTLRYMYYLTRDNTFLLNVALTRKEVFNIHNKIKNSCKKKLIFGAGIWGCGILETFNDIEFECFVDNNSEKVDLSEFAGKKVISFEEYVKKYSNELILISSRVYNREIYNQLINCGIAKNNIINIGALNDDLNEKQYFDIPELSDNLSEKEIFVDGGSLDGRSSICFKNWSRERFEKIYAVEPDHKNVSILENNLKKNQISNYQIITKGLWSELKELSFESNGNGISKIVSTGQEKITVDKLDCLVDDEITFIKMDIEGAEYKALEGCERIIKEKTPKLAISIYHRPEDIIDIPEIILSYNPNYKLYLRHYSTMWSETVLYAL